jgi:hypothetical protein
VEQPFLIKLGIPSGPTHFQGLRRLIAIKMSNSVMGGNCKSHWTIDQSWGRQCSSIVNWLEVFSKSFSYLSEFNCTGTICVKMNSEGIMFAKRGHVLPKFGRMSFQTIAYALIPVKSVGRNCTPKFNKPPVMGKFTVIILVLLFLDRL